MDDARLGGTRFLLCRAASSVCALPLAQVLEVLRPLPLRPVPSAPPFLCGLSVVRGDPIPVADLARILGQEAPVPLRRWVALRLGKRRLALAVEAVIGLRDLEAAAFQSLPPLLRGANPGLVEAIGSLDSELLVALEAGRTLPENLWETLAGEGACP